jgi:hypothetical protein
MRISLRWKIPQNEEFSADEAKYAGFKKVRDVDNTYDVRI